ncbi:MAG: type II toxin-antitoxin system VapC family toxin [Nitrososphaerota archaeon]
MVRFIDSNIFIYHIDRNPVFGEASQKILQRVESGEEAVSSTLVLEEVFIHVEQEYSARDIPSVLYSILSYVNLRIVPYTVEDMLRAAEILEDAGFALDWDDAIIAAVMERFGLKEIYSNDRHFDRVPSIRRVFE